MAEQGIGTTAIQEFHAARLRANLERIRATLTGKSADLLSYEEVRAKVRATETNRRILKEIPLDAIVGSVGRYTEFSRQFFPLVDEDQYRWAKVRTLMESSQGLPPIEVYQLGEAYFVIDGNHRVSVARSLGAPSIEAYVTEVETLVPLEGGLGVQELIIKERYARFLENSGLAEKFPEIELSMTEAGSYRVLERQIRAHQHWLGEDTGYEEAAEDWYRSVYLPVIRIVRERGLLRNFPDRTETDLYVWIDSRRQELAEWSGWSIPSEAVAADLVESSNPKTRRMVKRLGKKVQHWITPEALAPGPAPGEWREEWKRANQRDHLFSHILVAINGLEDGWQAFEQAVEIARREDGHLFGLHITSQKTSIDAQAVGKEFSRRCEAAGIPGEFRSETGRIGATISDRARWSDLVVVSLAHPPGSQPVDRLSSGFSQLLRSCPRPVLAVPRQATHIRRALLAFDGSPKSWEAAFVTAYMAKQWQLPAVVVTASDHQLPGSATAEIQRYLETREVAATYVQERGFPATVILETARAQGCDLIVMGGYGHTPLVEVVLGSTVDEVLRTRNRPVLICR